MTVDGVLYAEPNLEAYLLGDEHYSKQWGLKNTGQSGGTGGADIDAELAWKIYTGSSNVKVGIFDTGVELNHSDLNGKVTGDINLTSSDFHGTHVAGIVGAKANNNNIGIRGVDWESQLLSKRIFEYDSYLGDGTTSNKIIDAVNEQVNVLNHSWGGPVSLFFNSYTLKAAFSYAYKLNVLNVSAMGNDYQYANHIKFPASLCFGNLAVGATTDLDARSPYSNTGNHIDVTAPGGINYYSFNNLHDIYSTLTNNSYRYLAGTSMATPHVTGIASLLKGYRSDLTNDDLSNIIKYSAEKVRRDLYNYDGNGFNMEWVLEEQMQDMLLIG